MKIYQNPRYHQWRWNELVGPLVPKDGQDRSLLDLGCNAGFYMQKAEKLGYRTTGVEKDLNYIRTKEIIWLMRKHAKFHHWSVFCFYALFAIIKIALQEGISGNFKSVFFRIKGAFDGIKTYNV